MKKTFFYQLLISCMVYLLLPTICIGQNVCENEKLAVEALKIKLESVNSTLKLNDDLISDSRGTIDNIPEQTDSYKNKISQLNSDGANTSIPDVPWIGTWNLIERKNATLAFKFKGTETNFSGSGTYITKNFVNNEPFEVQYELSGCKEIPGQGAFECSFTTKRDDGWQVETNKGIVKLTKEGNQLTAGFKETELSVSKSHSDNSIIRGTKLNTYTYKFVKQ